MPWRNEGMAGCFFLAENQGQGMFEMHHFPHQVHAAQPVHSKATITALMTVNSASTPKITSQAVCPFWAK